jgi:hypothetical protein
MGIAISHLIPSVSWRWTADCLLSTQNHNSWLCEGFIGIWPGACIVFCQHDYVSSRVSWSSHKYVVELQVSKGALNASKQPHAWAFIALMLIYNSIHAKVLNIFSGTLYYCCHTTCCNIRKISLLDMQLRWHAGRAVQIVVMLGCYDLSNVRMLQPYCTRQAWRQGRHGRTCMARVRDLERPRP